MSLHFLIDGYNIIKQIDILKKKRDLNSARLELVRMIQSKRLLGSRNNKCTLVFDGQPGQYPCQQNIGQIKIIFSKGESADAQIKRIVQSVNNPREMVVVTDDKAIIFFTRGLGANVVTVSEFLSKGRTRPAPSEPEDIDLLKIELTYEQQESINRELRAIWK